MNIFRTVVRILGFLAMIYLALSGLTGALEPWVGGVGWAALAFYMMVSFYVQRKYEENVKILMNVIEALKPKEEEGDGDED
jgi:Ca2+/Na+ antiporter